MKYLVILGLSLALAGCAKPAEDDIQNSKAGGPDLEKPLLPEANVTAKAERFFRKIRLAELLVSKKLAYSNTIVSACISDVELANSDSWQINCPSSETIGSVNFTNPGPTSFAVETSTPSTSGSYLEQLTVSSMSMTGPVGGTKTITMVLSWKLYRNALIESAKLCESSPTTVTYKVSPSNQLSTIAISDVTIACDDLATAVHDANVQIILTKMNFNFISSQQLGGNFSYYSQSPDGTYFGNASVNNNGVTLANGASKTAWQCFGSALCFP